MQAKLLYHLMKIAQMELLTQCSNRVLAQKQILQIHGQLIQFSIEFNQWPLLLILFRDLLKINQFYYKEDI